MKQIPITNAPGKFVLVDDEDFDALSLFKWKLYKGPRSQHVITTKTVKGVTTVTPMHRLLAKANPGQSVSHRDGNKLNNQRANLVVHDGMEYRKRNKLYKNSSTGFRGVYLREGVRGKKYIAQVNVEGKQNYLGTFDHPAKAAARVDAFLNQQRATQ